MRKGWRCTMALLARLRRAERGVAAVEFALILPIMLLVYIGSIEASTLISMDRKVQSVAGAVGDLVARTDQRLTANQMQDYFRAASGIMTPYSFDPVRQVVIAVSVSDDGIATVAWSRQFQHGTYSAATPYSDGSRFPLPDEMIAISKGRMVIAAEASYSYTPLFGLIFNQPVGLYRSSFFLPRFGGRIELN
ncbi:pilus assembly protein [Devosia sp. YIM 151766]|uniref:TadE/TadG family type IV pilus assembly protein n=1 Tax=Devosia sp. YIM 151766 TaxID=3017325 RepID=UPI00255C9F94|nr:TadE/TadG family type IV pilus assembly protein [Devosia sp. YIM 151766]WIY53318.1 pilus assembly protein [Devosia sp. YIM 151766]